jgi:hypothetical protein
MDVMERIGDADGEDTGDGSKIAADKTAVIGDCVAGAVVDEAVILEVLGAAGSGSRRMPSVLTQ